MMAKKKVKITAGIIIIGVSLIMVVCFWLWFLPLFLETWQYVGLMTRLGRPIAGYIRQNQGEFPSSEKDLIDKFFLKKEKTDDGFRYFLTDDFDEPVISDRGWNPVDSKCFESITISYGTELNNIEEVDGKLFDKGTGSQVLLIDGPGKLGLKRYYERATLYWYEERLIYQVNNMLILKVIDGKFFDEDTGEQVFLIDGPHGGALNYEESSELYKEMLRQKDKAGE